LFGSASGYFSSRKTMRAAPTAQHAGKIRQIGKIGVLGSNRLKVRGGLFTLLCGKVLSFPVTTPVDRMLGCTGTVGTTEIGKCIHDKTPDDFGPVRSLGINGSRRQR
jgi:hypothetical protein